MWNTIDDSTYSNLSRFQKRQISINVASFLYRERVENTIGVFIIDSIPHCPSGLQLCQQDSVEYYR